MPHLQSDSVISAPIPQCYLNVLHGASCGIRRRLGLRHSGTSPICQHHINRARATLYDNPDQFFGVTLVQALVFGPCWNGSKVACSQCVPNSWTFIASRWCCQEEACARSYVYYGIWQCESVWLRAPRVPHIDEARLTLFATVLNCRSTLCLRYHNCPDCNQISNNKPVRRRQIRRSLVV
jgi:hypothetical protein